jgi:hypothetical protein
MDISNNNITGKIPIFLMQYPWSTGAAIGTI